MWRKSFVKTLNLVKQCDFERIKIIQITTIHITKEVYII